MRIRNIFPAFLGSILNSYPQVFFSKNRIFAVILILISFFNFWAGLSGIIAVAVSNTLAYLIGFNRFNIRSGFYGFNNLLVGLGIGLYYEPNAAFFIVLIFASVLTLFLTLWLEGMAGGYGLPYLSLPFLAGIWLVTLASRQFTALHVSESGIYMMNDMYALGGQSMVDIYNWFNTIGFHESVQFYFKSLGAIFFQYHLFAGILIAIGLLIYSRIAFVLSLVGFFSAYLYYHFVGADIHELTYGYIGFNFILTSIAIGSFFIIPSRWSFLWVILLTPLISIILTSTYTVFALFQLSVFSLPFNIIVLLFLYSLKFRERFLTKPELVGYQQFSPEKNLYSHITYKARFGKAKLISFSLPFMGNWKVTQGHDGMFTHKAEWRHAWDFEVTDEEGQTCSGDGIRKEDYYCYGKPVVAPAAGWVVQVVDGFDDNETGKMDIENNWGNTIILRHGEQLFSKLSHLKKGSFKVTEGESVVRGQLLASCGSSGRSPVPHIHFQIQQTPHIGSKTIDYPVSHFLEMRGSHYELRSFEVPGEGTVISNIILNRTLVKAFRFIPGQTISYYVTPPSGEGYIVRWEVQIDALNNTCLYCTTTHSKAWFRNDGHLHYFTHFEGDKSSLLFRFFLGTYKIMMGYYPDLEISDLYPVNTFTNPVLLVLQDFLAPFFLFIRAEYRLRYMGLGDEIMQSDLHLRSSTIVNIGKQTTREMEFDLFAGNQGLENFVVRENGQQTEAKLIIHEN